MFLNNGLTHSQTLLPMIESLLTLTGCKADDFSLITTTVGPGSFTGVRIGISTVKGLCFAKDTDCIGVSSLKALAYNYYNFSEDIIISAVIDARNEQVYNALFSVNGGKVTRLCKDRVIKISDLIIECETFDKKVVFVGDCSNTCSQKSENTNITFATSKLNTLQASSVYYAALETPEKAISAKALQPKYLQLPQAQRELNKRKEMEQKT